MSDEIADLWASLYDDHDEEQPATATRDEHCLHRRVNLDGEARRVFCRDCGREVDPFTILVAWTRDWQRLVAWREEAERRRRAASERLEEILRLERNARARLKKLDPKAKAPPKPWGEGGMP